MSFLFMFIINNYELPMEMLSSSVQENQHMVWINQQGQVSKEQQLLCRQKPNSGFWEANQKAMQSNGIWWEHNWLIFWLWMLHRNTANVVWLTQMYCLASLSHTRFYPWGWDICFPARKSMAWFQLQSGFIRCDRQPWMKMVLPLSSVRTEWTLQCLKLENILDQDNQL